MQAAAILALATGRKAMDEERPDYACGMPQGWLEPASQPVGATALSAHITSQGEFGASRGFGPPLLSATTVIPHLFL